MIAETKRVRNKSLSKARKQKKDEFYTQLTDIEKELRHYTEHFKDQVVYCNCDDPRASMFFHYFSYNFEKLGLKKLIATCYKNQSADEFSQNDAEQATCLEYAGDKNSNRVPDAEEIGIRYLEGDGDFRSRECVELLEQADIVVTNPPFSLFREYVAQLVEYDKQFLIIGNMNAITYKEVFKLIKYGRVWVGHNFNKTMEFGLPDCYSKWNREDKEGNKYGNVPGICWFTNLPTQKRTEELILYKTYYGHEDEYPHYDNYDAIEVSKVKDIPMDYYNVMGVPITFLDKYNPGQFEIVSSNDFRRNANVPYKEHGLIKDKDGTINGKATYVRILIKRKPQ